MSIAYQIHQLRNRGEVLRHLPIYLIRALQYVWIATVPKKSVMRLKFGPGRFAMNIVPAGQGAGTRAMFLFRERYEPLLTHGHRLMRAGDVAMDVGANQGLFTAAFGSIASKVIAVEPIPWQADRVRANIALNHYKDAHVFQGAVSNQEGETTLRFGGQESTSSIVWQHKNGRELQVKTTTLDKLIDIYALSRVDFIKLDIEGAEEMALEGGKRMLSEMKPVLCLEASDMPQFERISKYLAGYGYARFKFDRHGALHRVGEQLTESVDNIFFLTDAHQKRFAETIAR